MPSPTVGGMGQKGKCIPKFTAALFTTANICKQPKCPSTDEWIKMWYMCIYITQFKKRKEKLSLCPLLTPLNF